MLKEFEKSDFPVPQYRKVTAFASLDEQVTWNELGVLLERVNELIGEVFLNSGTLLGVVREGKFLSHDNDVDLGVVMSAKTAANAAVEWREKYEILYKAGLLEKGLNRNLPVFKAVIPCGVHVDFFPVWFQKDRAYIYPYSAGKILDVDVLPLTSCPITGHKIPNNAEAVLAANYGDDWRVPNPGFRFRWRKANGNFKQFWAALEADRKAWERVVQ